MKQVFNRALLLVISNILCSLLGIEMQLYVLYVCDAFSSC